jgi:RNA polymerase sigma factor (sigma-70 family)
MMRCDGRLQLVGTRTSPTDEELLASHDTQAFGTFYDRHARRLLGYFARRTGDPEVAADLTAETFASAIVAQERYEPTSAPALAWLYAIAARRLADYQRRGAVERRMQRALAMERPPLSEADTAMIHLLADDATLAMLSELPPDQGQAVAAHVLEDRGYPELAASLRTSEAAVRQRVSRGLATLRRRRGRS